MKKILFYNFYFSKNSSEKVLHKGVVLVKSGGEALTKC